MTGATLLGVIPRTLKLHTPERIAPEGSIYPSNFSVPLSE